jgi:acyl carrier protein
VNVEMIRTFIQEEILNDPNFPIEADQDLLLSEMLNSLSVTLLVAHLETACKVQVPPEDVTLENFSTLRSIEAYINRQIASSN